MKNINIFETYSEYSTYINGNPNLPDVSYVEDTNQVFYTNTVYNGYDLFITADDAEFIDSNNKKFLTKSYV